jgi:CBS domain-containing protein
MNTAGILDSKGNEVITATAEKSLLHIASLLAQYCIGCIVILDEDKVCGIVSEHDLIRAIGKGGSEALSKPVSNFMTTPVITARQADTYDWLLAKMTTQRFRHIPVVEMDRLIGIVSIGDLVKLHVTDVELESTAMQKHISSA